ncbi:MAG: AraC family transcriptional regulator [Rhodoferax sp.]|uniref:AraC family transcriptional regulator n=1 Tax=Rhodoferax sp. TaxID=50421 RepID=UPI002ACE9620|nr:AraC family transcriptional regulator [Rhodoferax sp.]MDZ7892965.1 AraC family transcriptional regulator [Rhodoferax sp.]
MPTTCLPTNTQLDRLSALLQAAAPRVELGAPHAQRQGQPNCLSIGLLASEDSHTPHSLVVAQADGREAVDTPSASLRIHLDGPGAPMLLREFAQAIVIPLRGADDALALAVQLLYDELVAPRCGQSAMVASAGNMLFIGLLRHLVAQPHTRQGLFAGLSDPRIALALVAMHEQPSTGWVLESLAERAGMSRTAFATRFKDAMGTTPDKYLTQLRLLIAQRAVQSGSGLKGAARASGYKDASALSRALGRVRSGL